MGQQPPQPISANRRIATPQHQQTAKVEPTPLELAIQIGNLTDEMKELPAEIETLVSRLDVGIEKIEEAREAGKDKATLDTWEAAWVRLLREYEHKVDRLRELPSVVERLKERQRVLTLEEATKQPQRKAS